MKLTKTGGFWQLALMCALLVFVSAPVCANTLIGTDVHTEGNASDWEFQFNGAGAISASDTDDAVVGTQAVAISCPAGSDCEFHLPLGGIDLTGVATVDMWLKFSNFATFGVKGQFELIGPAPTTRRAIATNVAANFGVTTVYQEFHFPVSPGIFDTAGFDLADVHEIDIRFLPPSTDIVIFIDGLGTTPIPEPASGLLLLGACLFFPATRRLRASSRIA